MKLRGFDMTMVIHRWEPAKKPFRARTTSGTGYWMGKNGTAVLYLWLSRMSITFNVCFRAFLLDVVDPRPPIRSRSRCEVCTDTISRLPHSAAFRTRTYPPYLISYLTFIHPKPVHSICKQGLGCGQRDEPKPTD